MLLDTVDDAAVNMCTQFVCGRMFLNLLGVPGKPLGSSVFFTFLRNCGETTFLDSSLEVQLPGKYLLLKYSMVLPWKEMT